MIRVTRVATDGVALYCPRMGLPDEESERGALEDRGAQRPLETDPLSYVELGAVEVGLGPDGLPVIGGNKRPPALGLFRESFICNSSPAVANEHGGLDGPARPKCRHLAQLVTDAEGEIQGDDDDIEKRPKRIRRFCRALASQSELMEVSDTNVYACDLRDPPDPQTAGRIEAFEDRQRQIADESKKKSKTIEV